MIRKLMLALIVPAAVLLSGAPTASARPARTRTHAKAAVAQIHTPHKAKTAKHRHRPRHHRHRAHL